MKIVETIEMTQKEKELCKTTATELLAIKNNLCDRMACNGMSCSQCPISKTIDLIADCCVRLTYISLYGTDKGYDEP